MFQNLYKSHKEFNIIYNIVIYAFVMSYRVTKVARIMVVYVLNFLARMNAYNLLTST